MSTLTNLVIAGAITLLWFQNSAPNPGAATTHAPAIGDSRGTNVGPAQPVISVHGICEHHAERTAPDACVTVVTREEFEALARALELGQDVPPLARSNLAKLYADYLTMEAAARDAGMEDGPPLRELIRWMRLRAVSDYYRRSLREKYSNPAPEEIDAYYRQHLSEFEKARLARVLIPRNSPAAQDQDKDVFAKRALEAATAARASLTQGVEPAEVQRSAYTALGLTSPPSVDLGNRYRMDFIADEAADVFALKPGEVSRVEVETKSYVIYKVLSRETIPEADAKKTISSQITEQKVRAALKSILDGASVVLSDEYFGTQSHEPAEK